MQLRYVPKRREPAATGGLRRKCGTRAARLVTASRALHSAAVAHAAARAGRCRGVACVALQSWGRPSARLTQGLHEGTLPCVQVLQCTCPTAGTHSLPGRVWPRARVCRMTAQRAARATRLGVAVRLLRQHGGPPLPNVAPLQRQEARGRSARRVAGAVQARAAPPPAAYPPCACAPFTSSRELEEQLGSETDLGASPCRQARAAASAGWRGSLPRRQPPGPASHVRRRRWGRGPSPGWAAGALGRLATPLIARGGAAGRSHTAWRAWAAPLAGAPAAAASPARRRLNAAGRRAHPARRLLAVRGRVHLLRLLHVLPRHPDQAQLPVRARRRGAGRGGWGVRVPARRLTRGGPASRWCRPRP